ncbi:MAG TPA: hypothetical protein V6D23_28200 [Candidatus Obscuribacterales bacterium]
MSISEYLSKRQLKAIDRLGDLMLPGDGEFPAFSELGCIHAVDEIMAWMPEGDLADLKLLLGLLATLPDAGLKAMIQQMGKPDSWPEALASTLRQIDTGLRGIIMSLYYSGRKGPDYSGPTPLEIMGVKIVRVPLEAG